MFSLYRAWFEDENYPLDPLSPPDTVIRVGPEGEHQFVAHRGILAAHSGQLKALLSAESSSSTPGITSVSLSSISGEAFAPLLNYMYTGRLEVTSENIFNVLFATHLLHMPGALEQCRAALLRLEGPPPPPPLPRTGTILRPVPNRLVGPPLWWPQSSLYSPQVGFHLPNLLPMLPEPSTHTFGSSTPGPSSPRARKSSPKVRLKETPVVDVESLEVVKDTQSTSASECSGRASNVEATTSRSDGVVLDVACCDGPVKFHRVLNENYTSPTTTRTSSSESAENDENGRPPDRTVDKDDGSGGSGPSFTCEYCRHTFKSHYCYKKHARRHLLPSGSDSSGSRADIKRREVRLLDLNVQYYPCKICGDRFPSYYFVHKHKKLVHAISADRSEGECSQSEAGCSKS